MNTYLNQYINTNKQLLFIDYDYKNTNNNIELTMYIYEKDKKIIKTIEKTFYIDLINNTIATIEIPKNDNNYDLYYQKKINKEKPLIALTFDDGPNHNTIKILNILEKYHIKATFFILGTNIKGNEETIKKMNELNMEIGNHMYSHKLLTKLKNEEILSEINKVDEQIFNIIKKKPTLIRPSYGTFNKRIKQIIDRPIIIWNIDTLDWKNHNSKLIEKRVMSKISDGDIILMHDIYTATANSLESIIPKLLASNYQFVTVSELFYYKGINLKEGNVYSNT